MTPDLRPRRAPRRPTARRGLGILAAILAAIPGSATAQVTVFAGGAAAMPVGHFGDVADLGYQAMLGGAFAVGSGGALAGLSGFYAHTDHSARGERSAVYGLSALGGYALGEAYGVTLTLWAALGGAVHARTSDAYPGLDTSKRGLMLGGGASLARPVGRVSLFLFGAYSSGLGGLNTRAYPTELAAAGAGVAIPIRARTPG